MVYIPQWVIFLMPQHKGGLELEELRDKALLLGINTVRQRLDWSNLQVPTTPSWKRKAWTMDHPVPLVLSWWLVHPYPFCARCSSLSLRDILRAANLQDFYPSFERNSSSRYVQIGWLLQHWAPRNSSNRSRKLLGRNTFLNIQSSLPKAWISPYNRFFSLTLVGPSQ